MSLPSSLPGVGSPHGGRESQTSDRDGAAIIMSELEVEERGSGFVESLL